MIFNSQVLLDFIMINDGYLLFSSRIGPTSLQITTHVIVGLCGAGLNILVMCAYLKEWFDLKTSIHHQKEPKKTCKNMYLGHFYQDWKWVQYSTACVTQIFHTRRTILDPLPVLIEMTQIHFLACFFGLFLMVDRSFQVEPFL